MKTNQASLREEFENKFRSHTGSGHDDADWTKTFRYEGICSHDEGFYCEHRAEAIFNWFQSKLTQILEGLPCEEKDKRIPYQALQFGDCPYCGQEVNREWVNMKIREVRDDAFKEIRSWKKDVLKRLK